MKFKKTGAALLVAAITVTGSSYAWANENLFDTVDLNEVLKQKETETVEAPKTFKPVVKTGDTAGLDIEIPEGYPAGNLAALSKAYENAGSETAKAAIKRNAERAIAKFEAKQAEVTKTPKQEEPKTEVPVTKTPVVKQPVEQPKKETKHAEKEERKALQQEQKEERKALEAEHKAEKKALEEEHKTAKHEKKALKEEHKAKKQEKKALKAEHKAEKHENKKNKEQK